MEKRPSPETKPECFRPAKFGASSAEARDYWALTHHLGVERRFSRKGLAEGAVLIGPVSTQNSLLTGKITGNFVDSGHLLRFLRAVGERIQWFGAKFPTQWNREFISRNRECFGENREFW